MTFFQLKVNINLDFSQTLIKGLCYQGMLHENRVFNENNYFGEFTKISTGVTTQMNKEN